MVAGRPVAPRRPKSRVVAAGLLVARVHGTDLTDESSPSGRFLRLPLVPRVFRANPMLEGAQHVACSRPTSSGPEPRPGRSAATRS
jgi:hypothetical protein